jgi:hypothetical protein
MQTSMPKPILLALGIEWACFLIRWILVLVGIIAKHGGLIASTVFILVLWALALSAVWRREEWGRWVLLALAAFGAYIFLVGGRGLPYLIAECVAVALLFSGASNAWFAGRARNSLGADREG